jgi:hypothetical protein
MTSNDDGNRFATITPDDHSAWIWLAVLHSFCYSICFLGFRVIIKIHRYGLDDLVLALAYVSITTSHDIRLLITAPVVRYWTLGYNFRFTLSSAWEVIKRDDGKGIARCFQGTSAPFHRLIIKANVNFLRNSRRCSPANCCLFLLWHCPKYPSSPSFDKSSR